MVVMRIFSQYIFVKSSEGLLVMMGWRGWQILFPQTSIKLNKIVNNQHFRALEINQSHIRNWERFL